MRLVRVGNAELDGCAKAHGVEVRRGDFVIVRTGQMEHCLAKEDWGTYAAGDAPGLRFETCEWIHRKQIAAICFDTWGCARDVTAPRHPRRAARPGADPVVADAVRGRRPPRLGVSAARSKQLAEGCHDNSTMRTVNPSSRARQLMPIHELWWGLLRLRLAQLAAGFPVGLTGDVQIADLHYGPTVIARARAKIDYRGGKGTAQLVANGSNGVPFNLAANAQLAPDLWLVALEGNAAGVNFRTANPARISKVSGVYQLQPTRIEFDRGTLRIGPRLDGEYLVARADGFRDRRVFERKVIRNALELGLVALELPDAGDGRTLEVLAPVVVPDLEPEAGREIRQEIERACLRVPHILDQMRGQRPARRIRVRLRQLPWSRVRRQQTRLSHSEPSP